MSAVPRKLGAMTSLITLQLAQPSRCRQLPAPQRESARIARMPSLLTYTALKIAAETATSGMRVRSPRSWSCRAFTAFVLLAVCLLVLAAAPAAA